MSEHGPEQCDDEACQICCEHVDKDCGHCIYCWKDCTEDMMARAFDIEKDRDY